jgi:hypothetical protein
VGDDYFPLVELRLLSSRTSFRTLAYFDSGARFSTFPSSVAEILELPYLDGEKLEVGGVGGKLTAYLNVVAIQLGPWEFDAPVLFSEEFAVGFNLLGRRGVFDRFVVCFDDAGRKLRLEEAAPSD